MVPRLHCDFETRSLVDLRTLGADVYARHYSTSPIMLSLIAEHLNLAYVEDFLLGYPGYQDTIYPACQPSDLLFKAIKPPCPAIILQAIAEGWTFVAHNARFEQTIWHHICHLQWGWPMPLKWSCTAARSRYMGIRANLEGAASDLEVPNQKYAEGKDFINDFCKPRKYFGAKKDGKVKMLWKEPQDDPDGWRKGLQYCLGDSYAEKDIDAILPELPPFEQAVWELDFKINVRGLPIDVPAVKRAIQFSDHFTRINFERFDAITSLRPTQRDRVLDYINQCDEIDELGDLRSKTLKRIVRAELPADLQDVIDIRLETSQASIKKLAKMRDCTDDDGRARGLMLYYGAHTGRWTSKRIQKQNMKRPDPDAPQDYMFEYLNGPWWSSDLGHEMPEQPAWVREAGIRFVRPLKYLSTSMRGFVAAPKGMKFVAGDYAQIEARTNVWLARCLWVLDAFRNGEDVYVRFAANHMYHDQYDDYFEFKGNERSVRKPFKRKRQVAKSAVLGCGFQMSAPAFVQYCDNVDLIITDEESQTTIRAYRDAHPEIADPRWGLWTRMEQAAMLATGNEGTTVALAGTGITFHVHRLDAERFWLICTLPSGRHIAYYRPKIRLGFRYGRTVEKLSFRAEWNGKSYREDTYGGKLLENSVQGIARDVCAQGALNADAAGYSLVGLFHDELLSLVPLDFGSHYELCSLMCRQSDWVTDLPIVADGSTMLRYGDGK